MLPQICNLHFGLPSSDHRRRAGLIVQQRQFPEIIPLPIALHGLQPPADIALEDLRLARFEDEERLSWVAFADDRCPRGEFLRVEGVGDLGAFVEREGAEEGDLLEEGLVHPAALEGRVHEDAAEGDAVEGPEGGVRFRGHHCGGTGGVVHEREFAEGATGPDAVDLCAHAVRARFDFAGGGDVDVEDAALDDVEVVSCVTLGDDFDVLCWDGFFDEGAEDEGGGVVGEVGEEEVGGDGVAEAGELVGGFGVEGGFPVCVGGVGGGREGFGGDGGAAGEVVVLGQGRVVRVDEGGAEGGGGGSGVVVGGGGSRRVAAR